MAPEEENWIESEDARLRQEEQERKEWEKLVQEWLDLDRCNRGEDIIH